MTSPSLVERSRKRYLEPSAFWSIRRGIPSWLRLLMPMVGLGIPLLLWSILSYGGFTSPTFLPSPTAVFQTGWRMLTQEDLLLDILSSTGRVTAAFLAATLIGVPIGILAGTFHSLEGLFSPVVGAVRYVPIIAFMPLIVIWVGLEENAKVLMIFLGIVFYVAIMVADAVKFIPDEMLNVGYTLGATRRDVLFKIIVPAALPSILDTLRVNIAGAWNFLVLAELLAAQNGLGFRIIQSQRYFYIDKVLFCIVVISAIGLITDAVMKRFAIAVTPWAEHSKP
jgi:NitT/TauT family transport system permease protein